MLARRKWSGADRSPVAIEPDGFDPGLRRIQPVGTTLAELAAALVQCDRTVELFVATFKPGDNALQLFQGVFKRQIINGNGGVHPAAMGQAGDKGQEPARDQPHQFGNWIGFIDVDDTIITKTGDQPEPSCGPRRCVGEIFGDRHSLRPIASMAFMNDGYRSLRHPVTG